MKDPTSSVSRSVRVPPRTHRDRVAKSPGSHARCGCKPALPRLRTTPRPVMPPPSTTGGSFITMCASRIESTPESARVAHDLAGAPCGQVTHERIVEPVALEPEIEQGGEVVDALARKVERVGERAVYGAAGNREARLRARGDRVLGRFAVRIGGDLDVRVEDGLQGLLTTPELIRRLVPAERRQVGMVDRVRTDLEAGVVQAAELVLREDARPRCVRRVLPEPRRDELHGRGCVHLFEEGTSVSRLSANPSSKVSATRPAPSPATTRRAHSPKRTN